MNVKLEDLVVGEIYKCNYYDDYLFLFENKITRVKHLSIKGNTYSEAGWNFYTDNATKNTIHIPSNLEKKWMLQCIENKRWVECPKSANINIFKLKLNEI